MNNNNEEMVNKEADMLEEVALSKRDVTLARAYVELSEAEMERIKRAIKKSRYCNMKDFAEQVLMIHKGSLSRKFAGARKFQYHEVLLMEKALGIKIEFNRL